MRQINVVANGISTDHPVPELVFVDDTHLPQHPRWIEQVGRHRGENTWGRSDSLGHTGEWAAYTSDPTNPDYAWCVRHHPDRGRSVVLVHAGDAALLHSAWIDTDGGPLLFRAGGYWWDGQHWYRPLQVYDKAAEKFVRRRTFGASTVPAAHLLAGADADPARANVVTIDTLIPDHRPVDWIDHLAMWASRRAPDAHPLTECVVELTAPELIDDQLIDLDSLADLAGIDRSLADDLYARGIEFPRPQTISDGRPWWSKLVAADWLETRHRASDSVRAAMSTPAPENPHVVIGINDLWDRYTTFFTDELRRRQQQLPGQQPPRRGWSLLSPGRDQPEPQRAGDDPFTEIARELAWTVAADLAHIVPIHLIATTVCTAVLAEFADQLKFGASTGRGHQSPLVAVSRPHAQLLDWLVRHDPDAAGRTINEIIGDAERRLGIPRSSTFLALRMAFAVDGALPEDAYDQFVERVFPPAPE